jgi:hypothetical protein
MRNRASCGTEALPWASQAAADCADDTVVSALWHTARFVTNIGLNGSTDRTRNNRG